MESQLYTLLQSTVKKVEIVDKYLSLQVRVGGGVDGQSDVFLKYVVHTLYCAVVLISLMIMPPLHFLH